MRRIYTLLLLCLFLGAAGEAAASAPAIFLSYGQYQLDDHTPYTELYIRIPAFSLNYHAAEGGWQLSTRLELLVRKGEGIVYADKYVLNSPIIQDTNGAAMDLIDLKRIKLAGGNYIVEIKAWDALDSLSSSSLKAELSAGGSKTEAAFSDIMLVDSFYPAAEHSRFSKMGYDLIPTVYGFISDKTKKLFFYTELYTNEKSGNLQLEYYIADSSGKALEGYKRSKTKTAAPIVNFLDGMDISNLPFGSYQLVIRAMNNGQLLCSQQTLFVKLETRQPKPEDIFQAIPVAYIYAFAEYLSPIAEQEELDKLSAIKLKGDTIGAKHWFYYFWLDRDEAKPVKAYMDYLQLIAEVETQFGTQHNKGYKSDRGRIYIKYGRPNEIIPSTEEPTAYPYEIWHYYQCGKQANVKFVFYNPTRMEKDFVLLHSTMKGELNNPQWKKMIYARTNTNPRADQDAMPADYGNRLNDRIKQ